MYFKHFIVTNIPYLSPLFPDLFGRRGEGILDRTGVLETKSRESPVPRRVEHRGSRRVGEHGALRFERSVLHSDRHSAQVVALTSPQCRFGVRLPAQGNRPAAEGILRGAGDIFFGVRRGFVVECLPPVLEVAAGELVVSSGIGGWMPDGLPVGRVLPDAPGGACLHVVDTARGEVHGLPCQEDATPFFVLVLKPE